MRRNRPPYMKDTGKQRGKREPAKDARELRFVGVEFKPAPDAQDRLRRLFTILAAHFAERDQVKVKQDRFDDGQPADEDDR